MLFTDEAQEAVNVLAKLAGVPTETVCSFAIILIDHSNGHTPVTISSIPDDNLPDFLQTVAAIIYGVQHHN